MSASPIRGVNVIREQIVALNDEFDALAAPLADELRGSAASVQPVRLILHSYEKPWMSSDQIADSTFP